MNLTVEYQRARDKDCPVIERWTINGRGWIVRPQGRYFVLPQYVRGIIDVLLDGRIIKCLPLINSEKLYYVKLVRNR